MSEEFDAIVYAALEAAVDAFQDHISRELCDPAYCDYRFTAWVKDANFEKRLKKIEIEAEV